MKAPRRLAVTVNVAAIIWAAVTGDPIGFALAVLGLYCSL